MTIHGFIAGVGAYLPELVLTNDDVAQHVDTNDEWIITRTGIRQRHIAAPHQVTSDLAFEAAQAALNQAQLPASAIDLIIVATTTPDQTFPAVATKVQAALGISGCAAFDVQAVCSGFVYALTIADNFIRAGQAKHALVIGAETLSRIVDWGDRATCVLFGDGAGAVVLSATDDPQRGIITSKLHAEGSHGTMLCTDGGPSTTQSTGYLRMQGKEVFRFASENMASVVQTLLDENGLVAADLEALVPHQANARIIETVGKKLGLTASQVISTVAQHANTSAASIPLALAESIKHNRLQPGDLVALCAMGGGFTWGGMLLRW